jgi:hypothetical protein
MHDMQHISAESLQDLPTRVAYLKSFINFNQADVKALEAATPLLAPLIPAILDAVYSKLLKYDITAAAFVPKNTDFEGEPPKSIDDLSLEHPQIALRKDFLKVSPLEVHLSQFLPVFLSWPTICFVAHLCNDTRLLTVLFHRTTWFAYFSPLTSMPAVPSGLTSTKSVLCIPESLASSIVPTNPSCVWSMYILA